SDQRDLPWTVPSGATTQGLIRVTRNGAGYSGVSTYPFTILAAPGISVTNPCKGYAQLDWAAISDADSSEIMQLKGSAMQKIGATTNNSYLVTGLNPDSTSWFAVRSVKSGTPGRRSFAVSIQPSGGACTLPATDNDYTVDSIIGLSSGRMYTSSQLGSGVPIQIHLQNLGSVATSGPISLSYSINGGTPVTETPGISLAAHSGTNYTFTNTADLSAVGAYTIRIWTHYGGDPNPANDTITTVVKQLANAPIILNTSYTEDFESADTATYVNPTTGFSGLDRCDFIPSNANGRARTVVNTGFANSGSKCVTLDQAHYATQTTVDNLITTFNLSGYSISDQLWLDFFYNNHGNDSARTSNKVWIRGSDQDPWIAVYTLDTSQTNIGVYQPSSHLDITAALKGASQAVTSSFQIKFGEEGYTSANNVVVDPGSPDEGYSFDDIKLSRSTTDVGITALVSPDPSTTCSLSSSQPISFKVKNYGSTTATNIPVTFSINGTTVTETIPSINGKDSVTYTFAQQVNMSGYGYYTITGWVRMTGDSYSANDTLTPLTIHTSPTITSYPYLEGFESSDGNWYTAGVNSSWQWGTPAKTIISKAANGTKCWVTNLSGNYNDNELSYLYSPCFDLTGLTQPVFSFSHIFQTEDACDCDMHWVEYSTDGINWNKLGSVGGGTGWYDSVAAQTWRMSNTKWHVSSYDVPVKAPSVKFRIVMKSDMYTNYEGVAIDDVHVFDKASVYSGADITSGLSQTVSGNGWVNFDIGGHRVASINPNGQNLGLTNVKVYIHTGNTSTVRNDNVQYYLDRNLVIQPATPPAAPVSVRFYFLDTEADTLMKATGCPACTTISDPYQSGVTQYSSPTISEEDGVLGGSDPSGTYTFHLPHQDVSIIPYDNGYYAEYQVSGFSEFWINNGGPTGNKPLPLTLLSFSAVRSGVNGLLQWTTANDRSMSRFIIQKSGDGNSFTDLDSVPANLSDTSVSTHSYRYTDTHLLPGTNYYRLRMKDIDGHSAWSPVRTLEASGLASITVYPNPVEDGTINVSSTVTIRQLRLTDVSGKVLIRKTVRGYQQALPVGTISRGIYLLAVDTETGTTVQKVFIK
ncbi:MAG: T9SS type A sorting domain-containing protein, partial [Bacteroidetes bacterium]|nr:T9SS type A sorting domain-containing protein [Bacteroidota bacterium]